MKPAIPDPSSPAGFARRFRTLMSFHNLTLRDIAAATRHAVSTVGTWKNGRVPSSPRALKKLADLFQIDVQSLVTGRPPRKQVQLREPGELEEFLRPSEPKRLSSFKHPLRAAKPPRPVTRHQVERYLQSYLDEAERVPGGLEYVWLQLHHEFPLDFFKRLWK